MTPVHFQQANTVIGPPPGSEKECDSIPGLVSEFAGGPWDGAKAIVVAWQPNVEEIKQIVNGAPIYILSIGGINPHYVGTVFPVKI